MPFESIYPSRWKCPAGPLPSWLKMPFRLESTRRIYLPSGLEMPFQVHYPLGQKIPVRSIYPSCWKCHSSSFTLQDPFTLRDGNAHRVHLPLGLESTCCVHLPFGLKMTYKFIYPSSWKVPIGSIYPSS